MISGANRMPINSMQQMRYKEHPIQIKEPVLVLDELESGTLWIYEQLDGPVNILQAISHYNNVANAVLVAEAVINSGWREESVFIHKIFCEHGHEESVIQPIIDQILHFADFYDCYQSVGISELEYNKCLPFAKDSLADFEKISRVYEYQLDR